MQFKSWDSFKRTTFVHICVGEAGKEISIVSLQGNLSGSTIRYFPFGLAREKNQRGRRQYGHVGQHLYVNQWYRTVALEVFKSPGSLTNYELGILISIFILIMK